jgi:hypothetical protein
MRYLYGIAISTAAVSAAIATGCIDAFLSGANARAQILIAAEAAAMIGVVSLFAGVLAVYLLMRRQARIRLALRGARANQAAGDGVACMHKRREVLDQRLNIDEPRLCSQYMIRCTCWSFCAGNEGKRSAGDDASQAAQELIRAHRLPPEAQGLPLVLRDGMDSCPFRFGSPDARSFSAR